MRHVLLTLAAYAASVPAAHAQSALAPTSTAKQRLGQLLNVAKRKDVQAVSHVAATLTTDPDATIRRIAAIALERMIDASTTTVVRNLAIAALQFAQTDTDPKVQQTAAKALATLTNIPTPSSAPAPTQTTATGRASLLPAVLTFIGGPACVSSAPIIVGTKNLNAQPFDVCAAFNRVATRVAWPPSLSTSSPLAMRVTLDPFAHKRRMLRCHVSISTLSTNGQSLAIASASVTHSGAPADMRAAEQDCVDAVIENLLTTKILPTLPSSAPAAAATPGASTPATPTPGTGTATAPTPGKATAPTERGASTRAE